MRSENRRQHELVTCKKCSHKCPDLNNKNAPCTHVCLINTVATTASRQSIASIALFVVRTAKSYQVFYYPNLPHRQPPVETTALARASVYVCVLLESDTITQLNHKYIERYTCWFIIACCMHDDVLPHKNTQTTTNVV